MRYEIVIRSKHQVGGQFGGPNGYMALIAVPDDGESPADRPLSDANFRRFGWRMVSRREYYCDSRLRYPGQRTRAYLERKKAELEAQSS